MDYTAQYTSLIGTLTIASDGISVTGLWMEKQRFFPTFSISQSGMHLPVIQQTIAWLDCYFSETLPLPPIPPLSPKGSEFQTRVWKALLNIPYGQTRTYGQLAEEIFGTKCAGQAVGNAIARNPIAVLIPCHRVIRANGTNGAYAGGQDRKTYLLELEKQGINRDKT